MIPYLFSTLYEIVGIQGIIVILAITIPLLIAVLVSQKYILNALGKKLDSIASTLIRIAEHMGIEVGEKVQSPGFVYVTCRWLRKSYEETKNSIHHIYVYCGHPQNPMTIHGCPRECPYLDTSDEPTGSGAFAGLVLGGVAGLVLGGPAGVIIGGLLGAIIGNSLEETKPVQTRIKELKEKGIPFQIHINKRYIRQIQP